MNFTKILKENEELIRLVRRHPLTYFKAALVAIILLLLPFFLLFLLFKWGISGIIIFCLLTIIGMVALIRLIIIYTFNIFLITNLRVILYSQKGLLERNVSEVEYQKIQDLAYRYKGFWQIILKYGTLKIQITGSESQLLVEKVPHPETLQQQIINIQKNFLS